MKNLKSVNEFWNLFKSKEEEEKQPETKKELSYDEICDKIVDNFDDIRAVDHYMQLLKKIGKEKEEPCSNGKVSIYSDQDLDELLKNKVEKSGLITLDLNDFVPKGKYVFSSK